MAAFSQMIFSDAFLWRNLNIQIKISLKFVPKGPIDNTPGIGLDNSLVSNSRQAIIWTIADLIHSHMYAALGWDKLNIKMSSYQYRNSH